jgi:hypothetical protein
MKKGKDFRGCILWVRIFSSQTKKQLWKNASYYPQRSPVLSWLVSFVRSIFYALSLMAGHKKREARLTSRLSEPTR